MTVRIEKDGWAVSGDTVEELKRGIQAVQWALCDSGDEVRGPGRPPGRTSKGRQRVEQEFRDRKNQAIAFLQTILEGGEGGVDADRIVRMLHLKSPKAIGARSVVMNNVLRELDFEPDAVYFTMKNPNEPKRWHHGARMRDALSAVKDMKMEDSE